jgi:hypothetical protein
VATRIENKRIEKPPPKGKTIKEGSADSCIFQATASKYLNNPDSAPTIA